MKNIEYDIQQFRYTKETNTFYADAWNLIGYMPDGNFHPESFPTMKGQFVMYNYNTNGFRRFRFVKEITNWLIDENEHTKYEMIDWLFESEDGIKCMINIIP